MQNRPLHVDSDRGIAAAAATPYNEQGCCPRHPDVRLREWLSFRWKILEDECYRCQYEWMRDCGLQPEVIMDENGRCRVSVRNSRATDTTTTSTRSITTASTPSASNTAPMKQPQSTHSHHPVKKKIVKIIRQLPPPPQSSSIMKVEELPSDLNTTEYHSVRHTIENNQMGAHMDQLPDTRHKQSTTTTASTGRRKTTRTVTTVTRIPSSYNYTATRTPIIPPQTTAFPSKTMMTTTSTSAARISSTSPPVVARMSSSPAQSSMKPNTFSSHSRHHHDHDSYSSRHSGQKEEGLEIPQKSTTTSGFFCGAMDDSIAVLPEAVPCSPSVAADITSMLPMAIPYPPSSSSSSLP